MRVASRDYERQQRVFRRNAAAPRCLHKNRVDMAFKMVDRDERFCESVGQAFRIKNSHQQGSGQAWTLRDGDSGKIFKGNSSLFHRGPHHRNEIAQMFTRGEFGDDASVGRVQRDLAGDHVRKHFRPGTDDGRRSLVATAFNT